MVWLRDLGMFVCLLAIIGAGLAADFAVAQRNVGSPLERVVAEIPIVAPNPASPAPQAECGVQAVCSALIAMADVEPNIWEQKPTENPAASRFRSGRMTRPISPPPKPLRQA